MSAANPIEFSDLPDLGGTQSRRMATLFFRRTSLPCDDQDQVLRQKIIGDVKEWLEHNE